MNQKEVNAFRLGYVAGLRTMLININNGDYIIGDNPFKINIRNMSQRTLDKILESVRLD